MDPTLQMRGRLALLWLCVASCGAGHRSPGSHPDLPSLGPSSPPSQEPEKVAVCPEGRWRHLSAPDLANVVLWLSHVLIRHPEAPLNKDVSFSLAHWHLAVPPTRTRAEALVRARRVAALADRAPETFAGLARSYSDDITTAAIGGALGGVQAHTLAIWPALLDCIERLKPGDTSGVVESPYGFHVFHRLPPPAEATVSGQEIVIAHDDAGWLEVVNGRPAPKRSRADAWKLANRVYDEAKADPERFAALVAKYSDHDDAIRQGDFGRWSTREPAPFPREIATLASLRVGEVAPPLDSPVGFRILKRTPDRPRTQLAMSSIRLPFDEANPAAEATTRSLARLIAGVLRKEPKRFAEFQSQHCCTEIEQWEDGRGSAPVTEAVASLRIGQVQLEPLRADGTYILFRRVSPGPAVPVNAAYDL